MTGLLPRSAFGEPIPRASGKKTVVCFSGGKDSVLALRALQQQGQYEAVALLTTVTSDYARVSMHGVRRSLLNQQARSLGLPLTEVAIPAGASNELYELRMARTLRQFRADGVRYVAFGDIFLEDLRLYREERTAECGLSCVFPIWQRQTAQLARDFIRDGFKAIVVCVDPRLLDPSLAGRMFDHAFLAELPNNVDPCGENGEFHTYVFDGPIFKWPITVSTGAHVERAGFVFCDVISPGCDDDLVAQP